MEKYFIPLIHSEGVLFELQANAYFLLNDPDKLYFVEDGFINIYTVQYKDEQATTTLLGRKNFFFKADQFQLLFGLGQKKGEISGIVFMAEATETAKIYEFSYTRLQQAVQQTQGLITPVSRLIEQWIDNLLDGISQNSNHIKPQADFLVNDKTSMQLEPGQIVSTVKKPIWSEPTPGNAVWLNGLSSIDNEKYDTNFIPISRKAYIKGMAPCHLEFHNTREIVTKDEFWHSLTLFHTTIVAFELIDIQINIAEQQNRLKNKYINEDKKFDEAMSTAKDLLSSGFNRRYSSKIRSDLSGPLAKAMSVVADYYGLEIVEPPYEIDAIKEPLDEICRHSKLRYRDVDLELDWWKHDCGAFLGYIKETQEPVAIMPVSSTTYEIYNPANDTTIRLNNENAKILDKLGYVFYKPLPRKPLNIQDLIDFCTFRSWSDFIWLIALGLSASILTLFTPILMGTLFDHVIPNAERNQLLHVGFALLMAAFGAILFSVTENYALLRIETKIDSRLQAAVWDRLLDLPANFFRQFASGDLALRAMGISQIRMLLSNVAITSILSVLFSLPNFILLFYYSSQMAFIALLVALFNFGVLYVLGRWQVSRQRDAMQAMGDLAGLLNQLLSGIQKFRTSGTENRAFTQWFKSFVNLKQKSLKASQIQIIQIVYNSIFPIISTIIIYWGLVVISGEGHMSTGQFLAFNAAYGAFIGAMVGMSGALITVLNIFPLYRRTKPILDTAPETMDNLADPGVLRGNIEVNHVKFRYDKEGPLILNDISLNIKPGEYVAFVGPSGCGKSTLIRLLFGFEKPETGSILYDGQDLQTLDLRLVRRQIGVVLQDDKLIPGDIFTNIVGASSNLTVDDAWAAAKAAALDEDIKQFPMGMHTVISEGATAISGGQRQRLMIARALVHKPKILIFDEATSALDNKTQAIVTQSLNNLNVTRIVIAHRLSTIIECDRIFVFDKGMIVQEGKYDELMASEGPFREFASRQIE